MRRVFTLPPADGAQAFKRVNPTYNEWEGFMVEYNEGAPASAAHGIQMSLVWMVRDAPSS